MREQRVAFLRLVSRLKAERRARERNLVRPDPPPRYDELYYEALRASERGRAWRAIRDQRRRRRAAT
jgi:hypothetical protein